MRLRIPARVVAWLVERAQRTPYCHLGGYMGRWWLLGGSARDERPSDERGWESSRLDRWIGRFIAIRVHEILRSDAEKHLHDHPWWSVSIILDGSYFEEQPLESSMTTTSSNVCCINGEWRERHWRAPGDVTFRRAESRHRLLLRHGTRVLTLFIMGPKTNSWGFYVGHDKVPHAQYEQRLQIERRRAVARRANWGGS